MTWDRWDDAMDALDDKRDELEQKIAKLQKVLRARYVVYPTLTPRPDHGGSDATSAYAYSYGRLGALEKYWLLDGPSGIG